MPSVTMKGERGMLPRKRSLARSRRAPAARPMAMARRGESVVPSQRARTRAVTAAKTRPT